MHPEWLTSTVTALAVWGAVPSSHSTRSFTLEIMRLWLLSCAQRSCTDCETTFRAAFRTMCDRAHEVYRGRGREFPTYFEGTYRVNSTFQLFTRDHKGRGVPITAGNLAWRLRFGDAFRRLGGNGKANEI